MKLSNEIRQILDDFIKDKGLLRQVPFGALRVGGDLRNGDYMIHQVADMTRIDYVPIKADLIAMTHCHIWKKS